MSRSPRTTGRPGAPRTSSRSCPQQRDLYAYLHDQTLRLLNNGATGLEIAETFELPPALESAWHAHGYYGSVSHNVKAIYQRYMGWFDGNPSSLWQHPPTAEADPLRGGHRRPAGRAWTRPRSSPTRAICGSPPSCSGTRCSPIPTDTAAKNALADVYERLGYGAENGTWRNFYLTGALELRDGDKPPAIGDLGAGMASALTVEQLFDTIAIRIDGPRAAAESWSSSATSPTCGQHAPAHAVQRRADPDREPAHRGNYRPDAHA